MDLYFLIVNTKILRSECTIVYRLQQTSVYIDCIYLNQTLVITWLNEFRRLDTFIWTWIPISINQKIIGDEKNHTVCIVYTPIIKVICFSTSSYKQKSIVIILMNWQITSSRVYNFILNNRITCNLQNLLQ